MRMTAWFWMGRCHQLIIEQNDTYSMMISAAILDIEVATIFTDANHGIKSINCISICHSKLTKTVFTCTITSTYDEIL